MNAGRIRARSALRFSRVGTVPIVFGIEHAALVGAALARVLNVSSTFSFTIKRMI